jgi:hypothetical protein
MVVGGAHVVLGVHIHACPRTEAVLVPAALGLAPVMGTPMLIVHPSLPVRTVSELVAYAKANPGKLSYDSFGVGTYSHLSMEDLKQRTGIDLQHVPYRGAAPRLAACCRVLQVKGELRHASYVENWLKVLKGNPKTILTAASMASNKSYPIGHALNYKMFLIEDPLNFRQT